MCSFYCPQQLLAQFLKLAFPDVPENYACISNSCSASSERTCCLRSLKLVLPSTSSVSLVILVPLNVLLSRLLSFLNSLWFRAWIFWFLFVLLPTGCKTVPGMKCVYLDGVSRSLHCRWQFSKCYCAHSNFLLVILSRHRYVFLYCFLTGEQRFFSVSCFCKVEVSVLLIELKRLYKLTWICSAVPGSQNWSSQAWCVLGEGWWR